MNHKLDTDTQWPARHGHAQPDLRRQNHLEHRQRTSFAARRRPAHDRPDGRQCARTGPRARRGAEMTTPIRLQLSRRKGFNLQEVSRAANGLEAVNVARPSLWGNPWKIGAPLSRIIPGDGIGPLDTCPTGTFVTPELAISQYRIWVQSSHREIRDTMRGKNLACWCKPGEPCHADVLLEIANR